MLKISIPSTPGSYNGQSEVYVPFPAVLVFIGEKGTLHRVLSSIHLVANFALTHAVNAF